MVYYDSILWGVSGLGSVGSGGDGTLYFTAFDATDTTIFAPSFNYLTESPAASGNYVLRVPGWTPAAGEYGIISDGEVGPGHVLTFMPDLPSVVGGGGSGGIGSGDVSINHNGGIGVTVDGVASSADCMRIFSAGVAKDDVEIVAFTNADYMAGNTGTANRQATTRTGDDGRWVTPMMLDAGSYKLIFNGRGFESLVVSVVIA